MNAIVIKRTALAALLLAHCAGMLDLVVLPVWIGTLVEHYHFTPQGAGQLVTLFLLAMVLASVTVASRFDRLPRRTLATLGFAIAALGFAAASHYSAYQALLILHMLAGLGVGCGLSMTHGAMGHSDRPHRIFACAGLALGIAAILLLAGLPLLIERHGGPILFQALAVIMAVTALALLATYPALGQVAREPRAGTERRLGRKVWLVIAGICLMTLNNAMVFGYFDVIGRARGFHSGQINSVLMALGLVNLLVVVPLALFLERRVSAERAILCGPPIQMLLAAMITNVSSYLPWAVAGACYTGAQIATHTFVFALLARLDPSRRAVAATPAMLMTGAACGPVVGGLLGEHFGFGALSLATSLLGSLALLAFLLARAQPLPRTPVGTPQES